MRGIMCIVTLLVASGTVDAQESASKVQQQMQGKWKVVRAERNGQAFPEEITQSMMVTVDGNRMTVKDAKRQEVAIVEIDEAQSPITITMRPVDDDAKKAPPAEGIVAVEATSMRLCWAKKGKARPTEFLTRPLSDTVYLLLERDSK